VTVSALVYTLELSQAREGCILAGQIMIKGTFAQVSHPHPATHLVVRPLNPSTTPVFLFVLVHPPTVGILAGKDGKEAKINAYSEPAPTGYKI